MSAAYPQTVPRQDPFREFSAMEHVELTCTCSDPAAHAVAGLISRGVPQMVACRVVYTDGFLDPVRMIQGFIHDGMHEAFPWLSACCAGDRGTEAA